MHSARASHANTSEGKPNAALAAQRISACSAAGEGAAAAASAAASSEGVAVVRTPRRQSHPKTRAARAPTRAASRAGSPLHLLRRLVRCSCVPPHAEFGRHNAPVAVELEREDREVAREAIASALRSKSAGVRANEQDAPHSLAPRKGCELSAQPTRCEPRLVAASERTRVVERQLEALAIAPLRRAVAAALDETRQDAEHGVEVERLGFGHQLLHSLRRSTAAALPQRVGVRDQRREVRGAAAAVSRRSAPRRRSEGGALRWDAAAVAIRK